MKKTKIHHFTHTDPENVEVVNVKVKNNNSEDTVRTKAPSDNLSFIKRDLKKTVIVISSFLALLIILYLIQTKTNLFAPIFKLFGL